MEQEAEPNGADAVRGAQGLDFEAGTGFLLSRAGAAARRSWARMLAERGVTPHHYGMLMAVNERGPMGQQRLSELVGIDPRNAVPVVDGLVERGLIGREVDAADRRRRVLALTDAGRELARDLTQAGAKIEGSFLRALSSTDQVELHRMLLALLRTVDHNDH